MTNLMLAGYANLTLYVAMAVLASAMIAFSAHLALRASRGSAGEAGESVEGVAAVRRRERVAVGAAGTGSVATIAPGQGPSTVAPGDRAATMDSAPAVRPAATGRGRGAGGYALSLSWLGTFFLATSVVLRGASVSRPPLANMFEFATFGALLVMLVYLGLSLKWPLRWLGLFVVVPVLLTLGLAMTVWYTPASELLPSLKSVWLVIHVTVATLSVALFTLGCSVLILHLVRSRAERSGDSKEPARSVWGNFLSSLPSARTLDRISYGLHVVAFPLYTFTLVAGAIWAQQAWGSYWNWDPKEVWTFIVWVIYAAYLHARATSGWSPRTANVLALVGYAAIIVNFTVVNVYFPGQHSYSGLS